MLLKRLVFCTRITYQNGKLTCALNSSLIQPQNGLDPDSGRVSYERNGVSRQEIPYFSVLCGYCGIELQ